MDLVGIGALSGAGMPITDLAALDSATAGLLAAVLRPVLSLSSLLMIVRIVLTWYPEVDATKLPWSIAYAPTGRHCPANALTFVQDPSHEIICLESLELTRI